MASAALGEELSCSICLNLYTEPVSLRCGHNFCRDCIGTALESQERSGVYSCPECREEYVERPVLEKNRKLCNIVEGFRSAQQEKTETFCTYCVDTPVPASKTCLHCETSLCEKHLMAHNKSVDHALIEPTTSFGDLKCPVHKEILKYYCSEDDVCTCISCWVAGNHVGHKMELLNEAYEKKKAELKDTIEKLTHNRQETERRTQNLETHRTQEEGKAADVIGRVTELFSDIRKQLDGVEKRILTEISRQEEKISLTVTNLVKELELQKDKLSKAIDEAGDALVITDQVTFLRKKQSDDVIISGDVISDVREAGCLDVVMILFMLQKGLLKFTDNLTELKTKGQLEALDKSDIKLDINTANNYIYVSPDLRSAKLTETLQNRAAFPQRFITHQVISKNSFSSGRHYWEVDVSGAVPWIVGAATSSIERKINERKAYIGCNDKSWGVKFAGKLAASHNNIHEVIDPECSVQTLGISLDYEAGHLSFYKLCDPMRHLHTFTATFTEPLHAAFSLTNSTCIKIVY
ncbi:PREDICTED: E3 ubiquitin-protein ligase Midline-1-like [Nanorana parkeri]|uniref:E3 ubiquitin-protein ligase Midline-1-like n=1 Tax=Nanorana parkeri TaxID=125878 RepID=UPI000854DC11|nr:PREDICTED: E3 ubiquitin-protein ligase Midline-1-like [Nanorana parkeri]